ncbi:histidine phosphatase superfamily [Terfezia claveryi]|nr:histidine phosphatase superfamily [Terfezia claveryi]
MKSLAVLASLVALSSITHAAEKIHAVVTVQRHGDRTYKGNPPIRLTSLGRLQCHNAGAFYRKRYLNASSPFYIDGISENSFDDKEVYAMAPDQPLLVTSGQVFLQGLYPPTTDNKPQTLANGEVVKDPVNGLQYTTLHSIAVTDPNNTIWLKADDRCPNFLLQSNAYLASQDALRLGEESQTFYNSLKRDYLNGVFSDDEVGYQNAYEIFDYINVGSVHNTTIAERVSPGDLYKLKVLADRHEWAMNGNAAPEHPALTIAGKAMAYRIAERLSVNLQTAGEENKFTLMISSYDAFLAFFGHAGLSAYSIDFMGLPNYAASMVFEMFSDVDTHAGDYPSESALKVRFLFRNGTEDNVSLVHIPIFGQAELTWKEFNENIDVFAVKNVYDWCALCNASDSFCSKNGKTEGGNDNTGTNDGSHITDNSQPLSPGAAGAVGAVAAIVVILLGLGLAMVVFGVRFARSKLATAEKDYEGEKLPSDIDLAAPPAVLTSKV